MELSATRPDPPLTSVWPLAAVSFASLLLHLYAINDYGWLRDELYYVACSRKLDFGYVDHPPLAVALAWASRTLLGESLAAARLLPILAGTAVIFLAGWMARELGGGRLAQTLAAVCALIAPAYLFELHILSTNAYDILLWTLGAWILIRFAKTGDPRQMLVLGLIGGLGLQNKPTILLFGLGVAVALLLTPARRQLALPWVWLGGGIALLLFIPHLVWQAQHGWPTLEFIRGSRADFLPPHLWFARDQVTLMHPLTAPVWMAGLGWYLLARAGRPFRMIGWIYLTVFVVLFALRGKGYYLAPMYPALFAAGGITLEACFQRLGRARGVLAAAVLALLIAGGAALAPFNLPLLPVEQLGRHAGRITLGEAGSEAAPFELPPYFGDMHGWDLLVAEVARAYHSLPPADRRRATIVVSNYGQAAAIDQLGSRHGLPQAYSGHNNYYLWGPPAGSGPVILLGEGGAVPSGLCADLQTVGEVRCGHCRARENENPVYLCRTLRGQASLAEVWPELKHFD